MAFADLMVFAALTAFADLTAFAELAAFAGLTAFAGLAAFVDLAAVDLADFGASTAFADRLELTRFVPLIDIGVESIR